MARARKNKVYFTHLTDVAISAYNKMPEDTARREKIYLRFIYPVFMKLAENIINKIKPGQRFFTLSQKLDYSKSKRVFFDSKGFKIK